MRKIRVVQTVWTLAAVGGAERLVCQIARHLSPVRYEAAVVCMFDIGCLGQQLAEAGVRVEALNPPGPRKAYNPLLVHRAWQFFKAWQPDIVHAHLNYNSIVAAALARTPVVVRTEHSTYPEKTKCRVLLDRWVDRHVSAVLAISCAVRDATVAREGLPIHKVPVIRLGIAPGVDGRSRSRETVRTELGIPHGATVLISVASLGRVKGHVHLLQAFRSVLEQECNAWLVLVGTGPLEHELRCYARHVGVSERVVFTGLRQDVPDLLAASDLFVLASLREGTPLAIMEAAFAGLPSVVTRVGGIPEIVIDGETALMVPPHDSNGLAVAIAALLGDRKSMHRMGLAARRHAEKHLTIGRFMAELEMSYESYLGFRSASCVAPSGSGAPHGLG